jgi:hypothetical protein
VRDSGFRLLHRHFQERFLAGEGASESEGPEITTMHIAACLGGVGVIAPFFLWLKYIHMSAAPLEFAIRSSWWDCSFFLTWSMAVTGFVTLLLWDEIFPDEADYLNLLPLPVRVSEIFGAKLAVIALALIAFFAATNGASGILFPAVEASLLPGGARLFGAHATAVAAGSLWVFFSLAGAQGLLTSLLPAMLFRRASAAIQAIAVVALLLMLLDFPVLARRFADGDAPALLPASWFLGIYDRALGETRSDDLAKRGVLALGFSFATFVVGYAASYRRFVGRSLERQASPPVASGARWLDFMVSRLLARDPAVRVGFDFTLKTGSS